MFHSTPERGLRRALVLHRRDYSNTSLLLDLFVEGLGRLAAIAKGARRGRSPASALLQPFQPLWVGVIGRGEVLTLTGCEAAGRPFDLAGRALACGFYLNEVLARLLVRHDPQDAIFAFYHAALGELCAGGDLDWVLRRFELRLIEALGYAPALDRLADGRALSPEVYYLVEPGHGTRPADTGGAGLPVRGATLLALARGAALTREQVPEARALMRRLLEPHLGPRPLKSRELFRQAVAPPSRTPGNDRDSRE